MSGRSYSVPNISTSEGYVPMPTANMDGALDEALAETRATIADRAEAERQAAPDPGIANVRAAIASELQAVANTWDAAARGHYADPNRNRYKPEGLNALDIDFERKRAEALAEVKQRLADRLDRVEAAVRPAIAEAYAIAVNRTDEDDALRIAATLSHTTPANRVDILKDLVRDATSHPGLAYTTLPLLRSLAERERGDYDLARSCEHLAQIVESRPGMVRAQATLRDLEDARRELGYASHAADPSNAVPPRMMTDWMGETVPVKGTPGTNLKWSASERAKEEFGDPSHRDGESAGQGRSFWDLGAPPAGPLRTLKASETVLPDGEGEE